MDFYFYYQVYARILAYLVFPVIEICFLVGLAKLITLFVYLIDLFFFCGNFDEQVYDLFQSSSSNFHLANPFYPHRSNHLSLLPFTLLDYPFLIWNSILKIDFNM